MNGFRRGKLEVWVRSLARVNAVYEVTRGFPVDESHRLTSQLRRAAVSVPSNIAEGAGRISDAEFVRFLEITYGSLMEATCQLQLAVDLDYMSKSEQDSIKASAEEIAQMLSGLRKN